MRATAAYALAVLVVIALLIWLGLSTIDRLVTSAKETAQAERDAYWQAEIAKSNAEMEKRLRLAEMAKQAADDAARAEIAAANQKYSELEKRNETLAVNPCGGLGRDRVQLLDFGPR